MSMRALAPIALGLIITGCASRPWAPGSAGSADDIIAVSAYEGSPRAQSEVATIYGFDGGETGDAQWVCKVDGRDLQRTVRLSVRCPNVVYVTPGRHVLNWHYHSVSHRGKWPVASENVVGSGDYPVNVEAGKIYRLWADANTKTVRLVSNGAPSLEFDDINPTWTHRLVPYPPVAE
jgi:hypothetical protein